MTAGVATTERPIARLPEGITDVIAAWRNVDREHIVGAALLGIAAVAPTMIGVALAPFSMRASNVIRGFGNAEIWAFTLLLCILVADRRVDRGARPLAAYAAAVGVAAFLGVLIGLAHSHFVWDALRHPTGILAKKAEVAAWVQLTIPVYTILEYMLIGSLATYLYVDRRAARKMAARVHEAALRRADQARQMLESQLQAMQARVEPRFLFGTLAQVRDLYVADAVLAERMLDELITYLRAAMPKMRDSASTVAEEVELVRAYLEIVKLRLGRRLGYAIDVQSGAGDARMPPMMMLPLVDHAVTNGIEQRRGEGRLSIAVELAAGRLILRIVDSGAGYLPGTGDDGIAELRSRLAALYGPRASLALSRCDADATEAVLDLPLEAVSST